MSSESGTCFPDLSQASSASVRRPYCRIIGSCIRKRVPVSFSLAAFSSAAAASDSSCAPMVREMLFSE